MGKIALQLLILFSLFGGCKRAVLPEPVTDNPVFTLSGMVDNDSLFLVAGEAGYFQHTSIRFLNDLSIWQFGGNLGKQNCDTCGPSLGLWLTSPQTGQDISGISNLIQTGSFGFLKPIARQYRLTFNILEAARFPGLNYYWDFGDGTQTNGLTVSHNYTQAGNYVVRLIVEDSNCSDTTYNLLQVDDFGCRAVFGYDVNGRNVVFKNLSARNITTRYNWIFHDGSVISSFNPVFTYPIGFGVYPVTLEIFDGWGSCISRFTNKVIIGTSTTKCCPAYTYQMQNLPVSNDFLEKIQIQYRSVDGKLYNSSRVQQQPASAYCEILSIEPFKKNANDLPTYLMRLKFACLVADENGETRYLDGFHGTFGIATPSK